VVIILNLWQSGQRLYLHHPLFERDDLRPLTFGHGRHKITVFAGQDHVGKWDNQFAALDPVLHQIKPSHGNAQVLSRRQHRQVRTIELHAFAVGIQAQIKML